MFDDTFSSLKILNNFWNSETLPVFQPCTGAKIQTITVKSQRPHSAHVCRYCDLIHWVAKYVSQTVFVCVTYLTEAPQEHFTQFKHVAMKTEFHPLVMFDDSFSAIPLDKLTAWTDMCTWFEPHRKKWKTLFLVKQQITTKNDVSWYLLWVQLYRHQRLKQPCLPTPIPKTPAIVFFPSQSSNRLGYSGLSQFR